jgi:thiol-disulfide isomerase/thioredoxin
MNRQRAGGLLLATLLFATVALAQIDRAPALQDLNGQPTHLVVYKGRILFLNFWATWCAPCRQEMPELNQLSGRVDSHRVAIVGIAADDLPPVRAFIAKLGIQYPIATGDSDQLFAWSASLGNTNEGLPFSVLLDQTGKIRWIKSGGQVTAAEVHAAINKLLATHGKT